MTSRFWSAAVTSQAGAKCRAGELRIPGCLAISTPELLLPTQLGAPPYLTPAVFNGISASMPVVVTVEDVHHGSVMSEYKQKKRGKKGRGEAEVEREVVGATPTHLSDYIKTKRAIVFAAEAAAPTVRMQANKCVIPSSKGNIALTAESYAKMIAKYKPSVAVLPFPTIPPTSLVPTQSKNLHTAGQKALKRAMQMAKDQQRWMAQCQGVSATSLISPLISTDCCDSASAVKDDFRTKGLRQDVRQASLDLLESGCEVVTVANSITRPPSMPGNVLRIRLNARTIADILHAVLDGFDLIGSDLPERYAEEGIALVISPDVMSYGKTEAEAEGEGEAEAEGEGEMVTDPPGDDEPAYQLLRLRDTVYESASDPLEEGCGCPTCQGGYSRGYIHHLLQVQEILGLSLLMAHNTYTVHGLIAHGRGLILGSASEDGVGERETPLDTWGNALLSRME
ncbi:tRNA-guanine(15) transglycosylase-like protein [Kipferlia bialata]|uniref:tRNA-guanine(15) transglycosylase-like protein n=1 Tax=Kipferlia bialata TaxID=797122 RepID=A0A9K3CXT3_9EUKA|nr:tRNA-guanine(15) transglycosylase-like protein [Kipferlia bialata]GIQ87952.1 tRNA-guanine(15) transglycosylase-like protein [Kipferlia bialata]|eukprot:g5701.t1